MDSDRLNRWLTLGANIGVLIGLFLLIVEIGQNTEMMRAQMVQGRTTQIVQKYDAIIHSDVWPDIIAKRNSANSDVEWIKSLTPTELVRVQNYMYREWDDLRNQHYQYMAGYMPEYFWDATVRDQVGRMIRMMAALEIDWSDRDLSDPFRQMLLQVAEEDGLPMPGEDGIWR